MMVVDASALVAIGDDEPERDDLLIALQGDDRVIGSVNYVEAGLILIGCGRLQNQPDYDQWLAQLDIGVQPADDLANLALEAYLKFGRSYHKARLNLGDCFAYALAKKLNAPLLYVGNDFPQTDILPAYQPT